MRFSQGGKFEHGFFSGFVSSLGGSYMMGIDTRATQVVMSAAIGGTAEALGGSKFANVASRVFNFRTLFGGNGQRQNPKRLNTSTFSTFSIILQNLLTLLFVTFFAH